ncbi:MAG TPA: hypothetical protein VFZ58_00120 [Candidatus Saccharimonadales bacterium]
MQHNTSERPHGARRLLSLLFSIALLALAVWVFFNRQALYDWYILSGYTPPAEVAQLANDAAMNDIGKQRFFVNKPEIRSKDTFSEGCRQIGDEKSNVLGCFTGEKIYIYNVTDPRLAGIKEVTAAHEMLHSAYMHLDVGEKQRVNTLIQKQLDTFTATHIKELIDIYNRLEPGELLNEMHSILATEQSDISAELEDYYRQYFTDRKRVVALADTYRGVFDSLKQQQNTLLNELNALADEINSSTAHLNNDIQALNAKVEAFNKVATSGNFTQDEFDEQRNALQAEKEAITRRIDQNSALRSEYEQRRQTYEALALDSASLQKSIDSRPEAPEAVQ